jgi:hypothetical protein
MKFCLIGSSRFKDIYDRANRELTLKGHVVYSIASVSSSSGQELPEQDKTILDLVHLRKIQESESNVLITDDTGYFGFSTRREMIWGMMTSKPLFVFVSRDPEPSVLVHLGKPFGIRDVDDLPTPQTVAEIIFETRRQSPVPGSFVAVPGGEA